MHFLILQLLHGDWCQTLRYNANLRWMPNEQNAKSKKWNKHCNINYTVLVLRSFKLFLCLQPFYSGLKTWNNIKQTRRSTHNNDISIGIFVFMKFGFMWERSYSNYLYMCRWLYCSCLWERKMPLIIMIIDQETWFELKCIHLC